MMLTLLDDELAPITSAIGFLHAPLDTVAKAVIDWRAGHGTALDSRRVTGRLRAMLLTLQPLTSVVRPRELLVSCGDGAWTGYFDCGWQGPDPESGVGHLAGVLGVRGLAIDSIPHTYGTGLETPGWQGGVQFSLFAAEPTDFLNYERSVSLICDTGRWHFEAAGRVQPFEDTAAYRRRPLRHRFHEPHARGLL